MEDPRPIKIGKDIIPKERREMESLVCEFRDVFAWSYDELDTYNIKIIEHTILLKEGAFPQMKKMRKVNPKTPPLVHKEL